jgi:hypothetical protein
MQNGLVTIAIELGAQFLHTLHIEVTQAVRALELVALFGPEPLLGSMLVQAPSAHKK